MKDIALHLLDLAQNSLAAKADLIQVEWVDSLRQGTCGFTLSDNGRGMSAEMLAQVADPWTTTRTTRKVGMGLPFLKQNVELCGGEFVIDSSPGEGTRVKAVFMKDHIDCLPQGDILGVLLILVFSNPALAFVFTFQSDEGQYVFDTREIKKVLGGVPLTEPSVKQYLREMLEENVQALYEK